MNNIESKFIISADPCSIRVDPEVLLVLTCFDLVSSESSQETAAGKSDGEELAAMGSQPILQAVADRALFFDPRVCVDSIKKL